MNSSYGLKKIVAACSAFFAILFISFNAGATHVAGAEITYRWISGNTFEVTLTLYRDCQGVAAPGYDFVAVRSVSCAQNLNLRVDSISGTGHELPLGCPGATTCSGGTNPGIQKYEYKGTIALPAQCTDWTFSYRLCCRNCQITTLQYATCATVPYMYVESRLNNVAAPTNSSPTFTNLPISFVCVGQTLNYNHGAIDANGDSLVYSFITPRDNAAVNVTFATSHSATQPLLSSPPMTLNPQLGDIVINPTTQEVGVMAVLVSEYRNGVLIGSVVRDMQVWVRPCVNEYPTATGMNGTQDFSLVACAGSPISFTINSGDANASDITTMHWNFNIPGATLTFSGSPHQSGTFSWTPTLADVSNDPYTFTLTVDDNHCPYHGSQTYTFSILVENVTTSATSTNVLCNGAATGSVSVTPLGGQAPYSFNWSPVGATTQTVNSLPTGTYTVHVTDVNGCSDNASATIIAPPPLVANIPSSSDVSCYGGNDGSATATVSGGTAPYMYAWSPSGGSSAVASGLTAGNYTVTITDAHNCTETSSVSIAQPSVFAVNIQAQTNVSCFGGNNGSASTSITGGTGPYTYMWSPGGNTTASASGLDAGTYSVSVVDVNGCTTTANVIIAQPSDLNPLTNSTPAICNASNGAASISVTGGSPPYVYQWLPGGATTSSISGIQAGAYSVTITDAHGCSVSASVGISNLGAPSVSVTSLAPVTCFGGSNGSVSINASGGIPPLNYSWLPSGGTGTSASGLTAGNYTITVVDNNNCSTSIPVVISEPDQLQVNTSFTSPTCFGNNNGSAAVSVTGGTAAYSYTWSPGGYSTSSVNNLTAGTYNITVTDAHNCSWTEPLTISQPAGLTATVLSQTNVSCFGNSNGSAIIDAGGGTVPYDYAWSPSGGAAAAAAGLAAGNYTVTITDANNCLQTAMVAISQPPLLSAVPAFTNVSCFGGSNGFASLALTGGTSPYSYTWSTGATTSFISGLASGSYTVSVSDVNNCPQSATILISEPPILLSSIPVSSSIFCFGGNNGMATAAATGGTSPYTYSWNPSGGIAANATGLTAGNYSVTITDSHGCSDVSSVFISEPPPLNASIPLSTAIPCFGGNSGSAFSTVSGGTPPYAYIWSPSGGTLDSAMNLTAGNYSVLVTDALGCTTSVPVAITQPALLAVTNNITPSTCGNSNGAVTASAIGGIPPYTYLWSPGGATTASISNLAAGAYTITVTDANNCITTLSSAVNNIGSPTATLSAFSPVSCFGGNNGSASVNVSGGTPPLSYNWSPIGGTTTNATGLTAGNYTLTILDGNNCSTAVPVTIAEPPQIQVNSTFTNAVCFGDNNGSASVLVSGGTGPYAYAWSPSGGSSSSATSLASGNYTVTITDANNCTETSSVFISQPTALIASIPLSTNVLCFGGNNGSAAVNASGGNPPYAYFWSPSGGSTDTASGLMAGNYSVTIMDDAGCITSAPVSIAEPALLDLIVNTTSSTCSNANGAAFAIANGGSPSYSYLWSTGGETTNSITGIVAGTYSVAVTDANGCSASVPVAVSNIGSPTATLSAFSDVTCFGGNDGSASVAVSGGTPPLTYSWLPSGGTSTNASGLPAGNYTLNILDGNSCITSVPVVISEPPQLLVNSSFISPACFGANNGSASVSVTGGTGSYTYTWAPGGFTTSSQNNLTAGNYNVIITDANNCSVNEPIIVSEPTDLTATILSQTNVACFGNSNGSATASAGGGTFPYTYSWSPSGGTGAAASGLSAGNYAVTISDAHNCTESVPVTLTEPPVLTAISGFNDVTCFGGNNGSASVNVNGGTFPYVYSWSSGAPTSVITGLTSGSYTVSVNDANNCTLSATILISEPPDLISSIPASINVSCFDGTNGSAVAMVSGGVGPYAYSWSPAGGTAANATGLVAGNYSVTITDANNCSDVSTVFISEPPQLNASIPVSQNVLCFGGNNGSAVTNVSGGTLPYSYSWSPSGGTAASVSGLIAGNYSVSVTDAMGCSASVPVAIVEPALLDVTTNMTSSTCNNSNGAAACFVNGGTLPYNYFWSPGGGITSSISAIPSGTYIVTVTDGNGCSSISTATVTNIGASTATVTALTDVSCFGGTDGTASVSVSGGTPPFSYAWSPSGGTTLNASGLSSGIYTLNITDGNNCVTPIFTTINQPPQLVAAIPVSSPVSCFGGDNGTALASAAGGTAPYTYSWSSGGISSGVSGLASGNYTITITDAHNCTSASSVFIPEPPVLNASVPVSVNVLCFGGNNGSATTSVTGGTSPYTYSWSPTGGTSVSASGLVAGNYSVAVTDAMGCTTSAPVVILQPLVLSVSTNITSSTCNDSNGAAASIVNGGTPPYNYSWSPGGATSVSISSIPAGSYGVSVTDGNGCLSSAIANVTNIGAPDINVTFVNDVSCFGGSDGSASISVSGGTPPFSYAWSPSGGTTLNASGLSSGNYILFITDGNNCITPISALINQPSQLAASVPVSSPVSCFGGSDGSALASASGGTQPYQYAWSPTGGIASSATGLAAGNYSVSVTDAHGCTISATTSIVQPDSMNLNAASSAVICFGTSTGSANVVVNSGGTSPFSYSWSPAGGTNNVASNLPAGLYSVAVTDGNGCNQFENVLVDQPAPVAVNATASDVLCFGDSNGSASATGSGGVSPYAYTWSPLGINASSINNLAIGTYSVVMTDLNGCHTSSTITIGEPSPLNLVTTGTDTICNGQIATLTAIVTGGVGGYSYQWSNGATTSSQSVSPSLNSSYTVVVSDSNGCSVPSQTVTLSVSPPLISQAATANPICPGDTVTLSSSASGGDGGPYEYAWSTGAQGQITQVSPFVTTTYYVTVTDHCGTSPSIASSTVVVYPPPVVNFLPSPVTGCEPLVANFVDASNTSAGSLYFWDFGDGSSSILQNPSHTYPYAGTYSVNLHVQSFEGCRNSLLIPDAVIVYPLPSALFTTDPEIASVFNPLITFTDNSTGADLWEWDLGDHSGTFSDPNVTHSFPDTGTYRIRLIATTSFGCKDTTYGRITIEGEFALYIPNAFTPDGNGTNDTFIPSGIGIRKFDMYIFNRWGTNIFHSTSIHDPWNGNVQGSDEPCQNDVYVYRIYVRDIKEKMHEYIGHVTLVR